MPWIPRGLREGIVTSRYPRRADGYGAGFRGAVEVTTTPARDDELQAVADACPTRAIAVVAGRPQLDRGACILCGRCTEMAPEVFQFTSSVETSAFSRAGLVVPVGEESEVALEALRRALAERVKGLRRSVHIRHVDSGSDGADEWEIAALTNPIYDVQRLGVFFTASPRHADVLLVTGVGSSGMIFPLQHTLEVMPHPKVVIAAGADAVSGGLLTTSYASRGGVTSSVAVDVFVPGSPATPFGLLHGILMAVGLLRTGGPERRVEKRTGPEESPPRFDS